MESTQTRSKVAEDPSTLAGQDPVLLHLAQADREYRQARAELEQERKELSAALGETQRQLMNAREINGQLTRTLEVSQAQTEEERRKAARHREKAKQLADIIKQIHRSLFDGNIYGLILRACLTLTGATRGLYLTARGKGDSPRIRAAIDMDGYPQAPPSEFVQALCRQVLEKNDSLIVRSGQQVPGIPAPANPGEQFRNCLAAPVVLLKNLDGVVLVADKVSGEFGEDDVETLLSVGDQAAVAAENRELQREIQEAYLSTVTMLANAIEAKDPYTGGHCDLVSRYARLIAEKIGLEEYDQTVACYSALLHDVGKIGVSDGVLNKPGPLLPEERELVRSHVRVGHDLIRSLPALDAVARGVLHHHEWYDGSGYPDGLKGEEIPIASRIVCVVDAYCAMITRRSYKEAYAEDRARDQLRQGAGTQFDPTVVQAFLHVLDDPNTHAVDLEKDLACTLIPNFRHLRPTRQQQQGAGSMVH